MVAELVETSRLWGRIAARIEPEWVEPVAQHLIKRSYSEPHWERRAQGAGDGDGRRSPSTACRSLARVRSTTARLIRRCVVSYLSATRW
ncbi:hypothetical protein LNQ03_00425 [Klebsiella pneumoniae subsp. pneumoniae]|nr:hypothetical protein [Klebsiella pneumoniae subsp. pneumoniae]